MVELIPHEVRAAPGRLVPQAQGKALVVGTVQHSDGAFEVGRGGSGGAPAAPTSGPMSAF